MKLYRLGITCATLILASAVLGRHGDVTLSIAGNSVPTTFITQNGHVYVPLADVAKALNMSISKSGGSYVLSPAGGANQVSGLTGKMGQVLNCGYATLEVVKMTLTDNYKFQFTDGSVKPDDSTEQVCALQLRVKNATQDSVYIGYGGTDNSALVDNDGHSYQSLSGPNRRDIPDGITLLPGAAKDFALIFMVPKNETPTQLVYGVAFAQVSAKRLKQFRIDLQP